MAPQKLKRSQMKLINLLIKCMFKGGGKIEIDKNTPTKLPEEMFSDLSNKKMELSRQFISNDIPVGTVTIPDKKVFITKPLATQAMKEEQLVSMMPAVRKAFDLMGDDIVKLST